jgi:serine/threonine protein kinase
MSELEDQVPGEDLSDRFLLGGRFRLLERLGSGGWGSVYLAQEYALDMPFRKVAVKLTHRRGLSPREVLERLPDGPVLARVAAECPDPDARKHLVQVFGLDLATDLEGRGCLVMEYVPGCLLLEHIGSFAGGMPLATARRYFREMCVVVGACHRLNPPLIHGDLKPGNILIDDRSTVRLVDFGWSRNVSPAAGYAAGVGGTAVYAAPEMHLGRGLPASDIYSLGLIMYEALCGGGPHLDDRSPDGQARSPGEAAAWKSRLVFPPIAELNRSVPADPELFRVITTCCRARADDRYPSIEQLLADLDGTASAAGPQSPAPPHAAPPKSAPSRSAGAVDEPAPWWSAAEGLLDAGHYQSCLDRLEAEQHPGDDRREVYAAICLAHLGRGDDALVRGGSVFERLVRDVPASSPLLARLQAALQAAAGRCAEADDSFRYVVEYFGAAAGSRHA